MAELNSSPDSAQSPSVATQLSPKSLQTLLSVIAVLLVILIMLIGYGVYKMSAGNTNQMHNEDTHKEASTNNANSQNESAQSNNNTQKNTTTPTPVAKHVVPNGWKPIEVSKYHYVAYRPANYHYRLFDGGKILGIDPNEIPEVGGYAGIITVEVKKGKLEDVKMEHIDNWMAIATDSRTEKNATWDLVKGTIPGDEMMPEKEAIIAITKKGEYVYIVDYRTDKGHFDDYEKIFDQFYPAILFK